MGPDIEGRWRYVGAVEVRRLRTLMGWTMATAAHRLGVTESTWRRWEKGTHVPRIAQQRDIVLLLDNCVKEMNRG